MLHILQALPVHLGKEQLVGVYRERRLGGLDEAGPVALFRVTVQGELAHHQRRITQVPGAEVQFALAVRENAQARAFVGQLRHDVQAVGVPDAQ